MKLHLHLAWHSSARLPKKYFRTPAYQTQFEEYLKRLKPHANVSVAGAVPHGSDYSRLLICDRSSKTRDQYTSEALAEFLKECRNGSVKSLGIVIGPPDGFNKTHYEQMKPFKTWAFGPMTLPHELAAVVAAEQLYRGHTILAGLPYHCRH